ncbi:phenoloxidase-activating factor 3-like [Portunus trituberculatus]|uniref:phenoloxidase-activating factor 3-like n=1 Tax=Portunus trituberculatus TaxID=210409 RepID=UPI001E1D0197|nr:phenoloxidase-activating factor 3-like [Portunus trituberculatus]
MKFVALSVLLLFPFAAQGKTVQGEGAVGALCSMGGGVQGRCQEVGACLREGGVVEREGEVHLCTAQASDIIVCCRKPHIVAKQLCEAWAQYWRGPEGHCVEETSLIVGGVDADPGEFPHIAIIGEKSNNLPILWYCGGTLLSPYYILTAAHCVTGVDTEYWVTLGEHDRKISRFNDTLPVIKGPVPQSLRFGDRLASFTNTRAPIEQLVRVEEVIRHPEYHFFKYFDIALLKLNTPASLTKRVLPACLPIVTTDDLVGKELTVSGWGWTAFGNPELTRILQKVTVPVVDQLECQLRNPDYNGVSIPKGILKDQLCAGKPGRDSCRGDSGGPLIDQKERTGGRCEHTVEGIVSFGRGCGELGVYTRVSSYLDWITGHVAPGYPSAFVT